MPRTIHIFPLGSVLFPGGTLPLKIFEQRYLEMTKTCIRDEQPFGVCLIREGNEVGAPAVPERVGCLATITQWDMPQTGMFHLTATGGERFELLETTIAPNGLITGTIEALPEEPAVAIDPICLNVLKTVIERAGAQYFPSPMRLDDAAWVSYRLAEILPVEQRTKQELLETADAGARQQRLRQMLVARGLARE